jgi:hypothetical protein
MHTSAGAIIFTVISLLSILSYVGFRSRIPLASLLLQIVMDISKHHKSVYVVAMTTLLLQASLSVYVRLDLFSGHTSQLASSQLVLVHRYRYVRVNTEYKRSADLIYSYAKWTPGNPGQCRLSLSQLLG